MVPDVRVLLASVLVGLGATLLIDLWALVLRRAFGIPSLSMCLLGRWVLHLSKGTLVHPRITDALPMRHECAAGWLAHYSIGAGFALAFVALVGTPWLARPTLLPALAFGIVTVVAPFFVLQPAFGLGVASWRTAQPARARLKSLATHTMFGVGLYLCALLLGRALSRI